jgi:hypothetical protein
MCIYVVIDRRTNFYFGARKNYDEAIQLVKDVALGEGFSEDNYEIITDEI